MERLRLAARVYVAAVVVVGLLLLVVCLPEARFERPLLFFALLALSSLTAALKVQLPLLKSGSTMSVSPRSSCSARTRRCWSRRAARSASAA
jgi:hypothetical protein